MYQVITIDRRRAVEDFRVQRRGIRRWKCLKAYNCERKRIELLELLDRFLFECVVGRLGKAQWLRDEVLSLLAQKHQMVELVDGRIQLRLPALLLVLLAVATLNRPHREALHFHSQGLQGFAFLYVRRPRLAGRAGMRA